MYDFFCVDAMHVNKSNVGLHSIFAVACVDGDLFRGSAVPSTTLRNMRRLSV